MMTTEVLSCNTTSDEQQIRSTLQDNTAIEEWLARSRLKLSTEEKDHDAKEKDDTCSMSSMPALANCGDSDIL